MVNSKTLLVAAGLSLSAQAAVMPPQIQLQQAFKFDDDEVITVSKKEDPLGDLYFQDSWKFHLPYFMKPTIETESLQSKITMETLHKSANALYALATESIDEFGHPTRVIGSRGHKATLDWIKARLYKLSNYYDISEQEFNAIYGRVKNATVQFEDGSYLENVKGMALTNGIDPFYGQIVEIPNLGCELHDFLSVGQIKNNTIALMKRGECSFADKSKNAKKAGFKAAIIYNNEKAPKSISGSLGEEVNATIATVGVPLAQGEELKNAIIKSKNNLHVKFAVDAYVKSVSTKNVIAETKRGDPENVVSLGSHTDGVETGPGINDDGSGTISLLTVAEQLAGYKVNNKVRFMFVAAEEEGLLGSAYYANSLTPEENQKIRLMMDYDMMASPNYQFQVYDANNTVNPKGSEEIKNLYIDYYLSHGHNYTLIPFDGRSDYVGFLDAGIPAGGIAAGAEALNTDNGKVLDQCYHELCDDVSNLNFEAFLVNTKLIAHSVATYANDLSDFPLREVTEVEETNFQYKASNLLF